VTPAIAKINVALIEVGRAQAVRAKRPLERKMAVSVGIYYGREGKAMMAALEESSGLVNENAARLAESIMASDGRLTVFTENSDLIATLNRSIMAVLEEKSTEFFDVIVEGIVPSYVKGANILSDNFGAGLFWLPADPRAIQYAEDSAAARVTRINSTTRASLNRLIVDAVRDGRGYDLLAADIREKYKLWSGTKDERASLSTKARSVRISKFEIGDAYEQGHQDAAGEVFATGVTVQKSWLNAGDDRVRPEHIDNQNQGWIDFGANYSSGNERPPTDPGCRCAQLFRSNPNV